MVNQAIPVELYDQIKAEVLAEYKAEQKAKAKETTQKRKEAARMFDGIRMKYTPILAVMYRKSITGQTMDRFVEAKLSDVEQTALRAVGAYDKWDAYSHGKADEAIRIADDILAAMLQIKNSQGDEKC